MDIADTLKQWRKGTQAEAAAQLAVSLRTYQEWEQGRRSPSGKALAELWRSIGGVLNETPASITGTFAEALKKYRRQSRWNRHEAAAALGVSAGAIKDWEQERRVPVGATIVRLLPLFHACDQEWKAREAAPLPPALQRLKAQYAAKNKHRRRKKVWASPTERLKHWTGALKYYREQLARTPSYCRGSAEEKVLKAEREFWKAKHALADAAAKARATAKRIRTRRARRPSPSFHTAA